MKSFFKKRIFLLFVILLFFPVQVLPASKIIDVKHGKKSGYSRIVLELDRYIALRAEEELADRNFELVIPDTSLVKTSIKGMVDPLIERIWWENNADTDVLFKAATKKDNVFVKAFSMRNPPRIVIDFKPTMSGKHGGKETVHKEKKISLTKIYAKIESLGNENPLQEQEKTKKPVIKEVKQEKEQFPARAQYKKAIAFYKRGFLEKAINEFATLVKMFSGSKYVEPSLFFMADCYYYLAAKDVHVKYIDAIDKYKIAIRAFPASKFVPKALYQIGNSYLKIRFYYEADITFRQLIEKYEDSPYIPMAKLRRGEAIYHIHGLEEAVKEYKQVLQSYPGTIAACEATFQLAQSYFENKRHVKARGYYEEARQMCPSYLHKKPEIFFDMGENYFQCGDYKKARDIFFEFANLEPAREMSQRAMTRIGDTYRQQGMIREALKIYSAVISESKDGEGGLLSRIRMADIATDKKTEETEKFIQEKHFIFDYHPYIYPAETYTRIYHDHPDSDFADLALFKEGNILFQKKRYDESIDRFKLLLAKYPQSELADESFAGTQAAVRELLKDYYAAKKYSSIIEVYLANKPETALPNQSFYLTQIVEDSEIMFIIGNSYKILGLYERALEKLKKALLITYKNRIKDLILVEMGNLYYAKGDFAKAKEMYRFLLKRYPESKHRLEAMHQMGIILYEEKDFKNAVFMILSSLQEEKDRTKKGIGYHYLGSAYKKMKVYPKALDAYQKAVQELSGLKEKDIKTNEYLRDIAFDLGELYLLEKDNEKALKAFDRAIKQYPKDKRASWALFKIGNILMKLHNKRDALRVFEVMKKKYPEEIWANMADELIQDHEFETRYKSYLNRG